MDFQEFNQRMEALINFYKKDLEEILKPNLDSINKSSNINISEKPQKSCLEYQKLLARQKSKKKF
jgi:hypothetical protein